MFLMFQLILKPIIKLSLHLNIIGEPDEPCVVEALYIIYYYQLILFYHMKMIFHYYYYLDIVI